MSTKGMISRLDEFLSIENEINELDVSNTDDDGLSFSTTIEKVDIPKQESRIGDNPLDDSATDYKKSRDTLYWLVDRGSVAFENALRIAGESDHPRALEVANSIMNNLTHVAKELVALQKTARELHKTQTPLNSNNSGEYNHTEVNSLDAAIELSDLDYELENGDVSDNNSENT